MKFGGIQTLSAAGAVWYDFRDTGKKCYTLKIPPLPAIRDMFDNLSH